MVRALLTWSSTLLIALATALMPGAAHAAPGDSTGDRGRSVDRWDAVYELAADGSAHVTVEIDFNFGNQPGHGPYWVLPVRQGYDETYDRVYDVTDVSASSPTGAPADVHVEDQGDSLAVRVGDESVDDVSGVHTYVLEYTVHRVMNTTEAGDELYWNVIGTGWETPVSDISVTVVGVADVSQATCWAGASGSDAVCDAAEVSGERAAFTQGSLAPYEPFTIAVAYPEGTYDTTPVLSESNDVARAFRFTPWTVGVALAVLLGGGLVIVRRLRRVGLDQEYAGVAPGLTPLDGVEAAVRPRDRKAPVAVAFAPPEGLRPGQLGTLIDEKADVRDVTATMVDLAVRGYLRIEEEGEDYALVRLRDADESLHPYETMLHDAVFAGRDRVTLADLTTTFHADMAKVQAQLYRNVTGQGWFNRNPSHARNAWAGIGAGVLVAGILGTILLAATTSWALVGIPVILLGVLMLATISVVPARTPEGTRVLAQARGFELYLRTAEGEQLRFRRGRTSSGGTFPTRSRSGSPRSGPASSRGSPRRGCRWRSPPGTWARTRACSGRTPRGSGSGWTPSPR